MYEMNYKIKLYNVPNWNGDSEDNFATSRSYGNYFVSEPIEKGGIKMSNITMTGNMIRMQNKVSCLTELMKVILRMRSSDKICWSGSLEYMVNSICSKLEESIKGYDKNDRDSIPQQINLIEVGSYECGITITDYVENDDAACLVKYSSIENVCAQIGVSVYAVEDDEAVVTKEIMSYDAHRKRPNTAIDIGDFSNLENKAWEKIGFYSIMTEDKGVSIFKLYRYIYEATMYIITDDEAIERYWDTEIEGSRDPIGLFLNMFLSRSENDTDDKATAIRDECYDNIGVFTIRLHNCDYAVEIALNIIRN